MLKFGNIFDRIPSTDSSEVVAIQGNCEGKITEDILYLLEDTFPDLCSKYCEAGENGEITLGSPLYLEAGENSYIAIIPVKERADGQFNLGAAKTGFYYLAEFCREHNIENFSYNSMGLDCENGDMITINGVEIDKDAWYLSRICRAVTHYFSFMEDNIFKYIG